MSFRDVEQPDEQKAAQEDDAREYDAQLELRRSCTIMMVDDEPTTLEVLEAFLQGEGYANIVKATDPREVRALLDCEHPDVLLLDLQMPNVSGLDILRAMRRDPVQRHTPVIILTSSTDSATKLQALELGATDFLGKPVDPSELALRLRNTLAAKSYRDRLEHHDGLTGLPNRRHFMDQLGEAIDLARSRSEKCALFQIDLDRFKHINDALGHRVGDAVLKACAKRLEDCLRNDDVTISSFAQESMRQVSRVGSDEFSLFNSEVTDSDQATALARRVRKALEEPMHLEGQEVFLTSSIGIAFFPDDARDAETLSKNAEAATAQAKRWGKNQYYFYSSALNAESVARFSLETQLRSALERNELSLHYQPKVNIASGAIIGAEALMRWEHPELGFVPPIRFISIAEDGGLIEHLGAWGLMTACRQNKAWQDAGLEPIRIAVNMSALQLRDKQILETIMLALQDSAMNPRQLVIEITESVLMENPQEASYLLGGMKDMGLKISVDDFGTGYSSLSSLKRFPIDELKIDRSFLEGLPEDPDNGPIVTAIIAMAHSLGLTVVAEGVEEEAQLSFLAERGCDQYQGYFCSRPIPAVDWPELIRRNAKR